MERKREREKERKSGEKEYWSERVLERIDRITKTNCHAQAKQQGVDIRDLVFIVYQRNS